MKLTKQKLNSLRVTMKSFLPAYSMMYRIDLVEANPEKLDISDVIWLELFSGDLLPEDLLRVTKEIKLIVFSHEPMYEHSYNCYLDEYIQTLETKEEYLKWSYTDLSRAATKYLECKELLEGVL